MIHTPTPQLTNVFFVDAHSERGHVRYQVIANEYLAQMLGDLIGRIGIYGREDTDIIAPGGVLQVWRQTVTSYTQGGSLILEAMSADEDTNYFVIDDSVSPKPISRGTYDRLLSHLRR